MDAQQAQIFKTMCEWYQGALIDIMVFHRNLEQRLKETEEIIEALEEKIQCAKENNEIYEGFVGMKNEIYYLKYNILELT